MHGAKFAINFTFSGVGQISKRLIYFSKMSVSQEKDSLDKG